ncbi:hypothetical protein OROMI_000418 [Orobanche minor]
MKNDKSRVEIHLPLEIIQLIQSFLSGDAAAQTTVLSKLWHRAWSTRPNLDFDQINFPISTNTFSELTKKTMQRYEDLNLKVETLRLKMSRIEDPNIKVSLANELIARVMKLGVVDLNLDLSSGISDPCCLLTDEVLGSQTLTRLSLSGCFTIDLRLTNTYSNIKSLVLRHLVTVKGDILRDFVSRFPLIEELRLSSLESIKQGHDSRSHRQHEFKKLEYLQIGCFDVKNIYFLSAGGAIYHCLKELVVTDCSYGIVTRRICSPSLELINICIGDGSIWYAYFDIPNIRTFEFKGCSLSRFRFKSNTSTSRVWESILRLTGPPSQPAASWFLGFNKLVKTMLRARSRVSLHIYVFSRPDIYRYEGKKAHVESLTLACSPTYFSDFLDTLLLMCRPKLLIVSCGEYLRKFLNEYVHRIVAHGLVQKVDFGSGLSSY